MRQGQQHRRGRSRNNTGSGSNGHHQGQSSTNNNSNRKGQNPLTRSFESNGPDVKIRGTPAHVAEKYIALARDAHAVGDPVLAENYLQHAEHYNRIILAYREQQGLDAGPNSGVMRPRLAGDPSIDGDFSDEDGEDFPGDNGSQPMVRGQEPQPGGFESPRFEDRQPRDNNAPRHQQNRNNNNNNRDRQDGNEPRRFQNDRPDSRGQDSRGQDFRGPDARGDSRGDGRTDNRRDQQPPHRSEGRPERFDRPDRNQDRNQDRNFDRGIDPQNASPRPDAEQRQPRFERPERVERHELADRQPVIAAPITEPAAIEPVRRRERPPVAAAPVPAHEQPEFLRRPVRRPRRDAAVETAGDAPASDDTGSQD